MNMTTPCLSLRAWIVSLLVTSTAFTQGNCTSCYGTSVTNCIRFHNTAAVGGIVQFPNFNTPGGNVAGDCLWKVYPKELFYRASGHNCFYGYIFPITYVNYLATQTYMHPGFEYRRVRMTPQGWKVPDFDRPPVYLRGPHPTPQLPTANGYWLWRSYMESGREFDWGNEDIAFCITAPAGVSAASGAMAYQAFHSQGERYANAPQPSFSGRFNAATRQVELLVPPLTVEATELMASICVVEPIVEFGATTSGGGTRPEEWHTGVGAFYNDLATSGGVFRFRGESNGSSITPGFCYGIPLASAVRHSPAALIPGRNCLTDVSPVDPLFNLFLTLGQFRLMDERYRNTQAVERFYVTDWIVMPNDLALRGVQIIVTWTHWCPPPYSLFGGPGNSVLIRFG